MTLEQAAPAEDQRSTLPVGAAEPGGPTEDTAPPQPAQAPARQPSPQPSPAALMAANTRLGQQNAAYREALGLDRRATDEEVRARIKELTEGSGPGDAEMDYDPRLDEERARYIDREWQTATRVYGPETVQVARSVQELALSAASPMEFLDELNKLIGRDSKPQAGQPAQVPQQGQQQAPTPQQQRAADVAPEGDGPVGLTVQPEQDELGTGDVQGAAERLFSRINILSGGRR